MPERIVGERRREERFPVEEEGYLRALSPLALESWRIQIVNRSTNGLRIKSPTSFSPGTLVQIRVKREILLGKVRYSKGLPRESGFAVGILVEGSTGLKLKM